MTPSTPSTMTRTITTRTICTSEHSSAPLVVFHVSLMMCHTTLAQVVHESVIFTPCCTCVVLLDLHLPPLSTSTCPFTVFFHSSVLMHPDLHTDLDNLDSVENKTAPLRQGEPRRLRRHPLPHSPSAIGKINSPSLGNITSLALSLF